MGKKTPAITIPQVRQIFTKLLQNPPPSRVQIAEEITQVLQRTEEARIYHYYKATKRFPPRRHAANIGRKKVKRKQEQ